MRLLGGILCLALLAGCAPTDISAEPAGSPAATSAQPDDKPTYTTGGNFNMKPGPLPLGLRQKHWKAAMDGLAVTYVASVRTGRGNNTYPRSLVVTLRVRNRSPHPLILSVDFRQPGHPALEVPPAPCGPIDRLPLTIQPRQRVAGCVAYFVPAAGGKLVFEGLGESPVEEIRQHVPVPEMRRIAVS